MPRSLAEYCRSLLDFAGWRAFWVGLLVLAGALVEGIGLLAILPFLEVVAGEAQTAFGQSVDRWLTSFGLVSRDAQLAAMLGAFLALIALRGLIGWLRSVRLRALAQEFVEHWRLRVFRAINDADWLQVLRLQKHEAMHAVTADVGRIASGTDQILRGITTLVLVVVQVAVAVALSPVLAALVLGFVLLAALAGAPLLAKRARLLGERQTHFGRGLQQTMLQFLSGLKIARAEGAHDYPEEVANLSRRMRIDLVRYAGQTALAQAAFQFASAIGICLTAFVGLVILNLPLFTLAAFMVVLLRISTPVFGLVQNVQAVSHMLPAFEHLGSLQDKLRRPGAAAVQLRGERIAGRDAAIVPVEFERVSLTYPGQEEPVLRDVNVALAPGQMVALTGPSGTGKTTLLDLAAGVFPPSTGAVSHGGAVLAGDTQRSQLAYLSQDPLLFDVSLRRNLLWGGLEADEAEIAEVLRVCEAEHIVGRLPDGLDTRAGERGSMFSGGERQRLCLAGKLLRKPKLLLLDEATSAIDRETELKILARLREHCPGTAIVLATHRPVDHDLFDCIWSMGEDGQVDVRGRAA